MEETAQTQIINHFLVPLHEKMSEEEKQEFLIKNNISTKQLPQISSNDAAIKSLNANIGDVIKITRKSPTAKETIFYRVVING